MIRGGGEARFPQQAEIQLRESEGTNWRSKQENPGWEEKHYVKKADGGKRDGLRLTVRGGGLQPGRAGKGVKQIWRGRRWAPGNQRIEETKKITKEECTV